MGLRIAGALAREPHATTGGRLSGQECARRIRANLAYAKAVRDLAGRSSKVTRLKTFKGPLPGIYANGRRGESA